MDSVPRYVSDSDSIFTNPTYSLYMPLLASMHAPRPVTAVDTVPGHLVAGSSLPAYLTRSRPCQEEVFGVFETGDNSDFNQPFHQDWSTQGEQLGSGKKQNSSSH